MTHIDDELYAKIVRQMPIPCVDLFVMNETGKVLMVGRKNEPAAGEWWFPGGRVLYGESRAAAARRKLEQECGLKGTLLGFAGTFDAIIPLPDDGISHAIITLTSMFVEPAGQTVRLDEQSSIFRWRPVREWMESSWSTEELTLLARRMLYAATTDK